MAHYTDQQIVKAHEFAADLLGQARPFLAANPGITPQLVVAQLSYALGAWIADAHNEDNTPSPELTLLMYQGIMSNGMMDAMRLQEQQQAKVA